MHDTASLLRIYLNDHLAGATAGSALVSRMVRVQNRSFVGELRRLDEEIAADKAELLRLMAELGVSTRRYKVAIGWIAEKVGRLKTNGRLARRSPLSDVLELEALRGGVEAKEAAWQALETMRTEPSQIVRLRRLSARAAEQSRTLVELHRQAAEAVLGRETIGSRRA